MTELQGIFDINNFLLNHKLSVLICSTRTCNVCKPLKQQITKTLENNTSVALAEIFLDDVEEAKGYFGVFSVPIVLVFVEGKEAKRYSAAMDIREFQSTILRYEELLG